MPKQIYLDDFEPENVPPDKANGGEYLNIIVKELFDSEALCEINDGGLDYLSVRFPEEVINNLSLKFNDKFIWYPQNRDNILPEDCYLQPKDQKIVESENESVKNDLEQTVNRDKYVEVMVRENLDSQEYSCIVRIERENSRIRFPINIIEELGLSIGEGFVWYPQDRDYILPSECFHEPLEWDAERSFKEAEEAIERALPYTVPMGSDDSNKKGD